MFIVLVSNFHTSACIRVFRTNTFILAIITLSRDPATTPRNSTRRKRKNKRPRLMKYYWNQMMNQRKKNQQERSAFVSVRLLNICLVVIEKLKLVQRSIKCLKAKIKIINNNFSIRTLCFSSAPMHGTLECDLYCSFYNHFIIIGTLFLLLFSLALNIFMAQYSIKQPRKPPKWGRPFQCKSLTREKKSFDLNNKHWKKLSTVDGLTVMKLKNSTRKLSYAQKRLNNGGHHEKGLFGYGELQLVKVKLRDYLKSTWKILF